MPFTELLFIGVGLAADAFAVAMCRGFEEKRFTWKNGLLTAFFFGFFQAAMPLIGFLLASLFADEIEAFDHWLAFVLLGFLGLKMVYEGIKEEVGNRREKREKEEAERGKKSAARPRRDVSFTAILASIVFNRCRGAQKRGGRFPYKRYFGNRKSELGNPKRVYIRKGGTQQVRP